MLDIVAKKNKGKVETATLNREVRERLTMTLSAGLSGIQNTWAGLFQEKTHQKHRSCDGDSVLWVEEQGGWQCDWRPAASFAESSAL